MSDKVIEWLEKNVNKDGSLYFLQGMYPGYIHCYFKSDDRQFCTFYRDCIEELIKREEVEEETDAETN